MAATTLASAIVDDVLRRLSETTTNPRYWSRAEILDLVWEGLLECTLMSGHLQATVNVTLTGNTLQAAPNHVAILHVRIGNNSLQKYSVDELDASRPAWDSEPQKVDPTMWMPFGLTKMMTHPRTNVTGKVAAVTVLQLPTVLAEGDTIPLEDEYVSALSDYAFSVARLKEGGAELRDAMTNYDGYLKLTGELTERVAWKSAPEWAKTPKTKLADAVPRQSAGRRRG